MILLVGGTGHLGHRLLPLLGGRAVRVLSRVADSDLAIAFPDCEFVLGDVRDRETLARAVKGADVVVSLLNGFGAGPGVTPRTVDRDGNVALIEAAERAGSAVVLMSVVRAARDNPVELSRMKYAAEQRLRRSTVPWTIVRSEGFLETWVELFASTADEHGTVTVLGRGDNPIAFVSIDDVARVLARAITDDGLRGRTIEVAGAHRHTLTDLAAQVMRAHGVQGRPRHVNRAALHLMAGTVGVLRPEIGRQVRAGLALDRVASPVSGPQLLAEFPDLPRRTLADVLALGPR